MTRSAMRRALAGLVLTASALTVLSACAAFPEGDSICTEQGPSHPDWPHCAPNRPGGRSSPADDPVDPRGG